MKAENVLEFWREAGPKLWWSVNSDFDQKVTKYFKTLHDKLKKNQLNWKTTASDLLAQVIILDQFSRNIYRGQKMAFATDEQAQQISLQAIDRQLDMACVKTDRLWFYMPFMHAENEKLQHLSVNYISERIGNKINIKFAQEHADIIFRFGRFPHRNAVFGRKNTAEEELYLAENGSSKWGQ